VHLCVRIISFHDATVPSGTGPPSYRGFTVTLRHTTIGRTSLDEWSVWSTDLTQHTTLKTVTHGIRTRNPSKRAAADPRLKPRGQWNWLPHNYCNDTSLFPYKVITVIQCNGNGLCPSWGASWIIVRDVMQKKVSVFRDVRTLWFNV
jgi:hypothetical protein